MPPSEPPDRQSELADPERVEDSPLGSGLIADGDAREGSTVLLAGRRVPRGRSAGAVSAAEQICADDAVFLGVQNLAGSNQRRPPVARGIGRAGEGVDDENLAPFADRNAVVAVGDDQVGQHLARLQGEAPEPSGDDLAGLRVGGVVHVAQATKTQVVAYGRNARVVDDEGR